MAKSLIELDARMTLEDDIEPRETKSEHNSGAVSVGIGGSGPHTA